MAFPFYGRWDEEKWQIVPFYYFLFSPPCLGVENNWILILAIFLPFTEAITCERRVHSKYSQSSSVLNTMSWGLLWPLTSSSGSPSYGKHQPHPLTPLNVCSEMCYSVTGLWPRLLYVLRKISLSFSTEISYCLKSGSSDIWGSSQFDGFCYLEEAWPVPKLRCFLEY